MNTNKFSSLAIIVFNTFSYFLMANILIVPYLMDSYKSNAFIYPILFIPFSYLIILIFNTKSIKGIKKTILKSFVIRNLLMLYYFFLAFLLLFYLSDVLTDMSFHMTNIRFVYISSLAIACYIAYYGLSTIINLSTLFLLLIGILLILPIFTAEFYFNHDLVLPLYKPGKDIYKIFILALIPLDMLLFNIFENHTFKRMKKRYFMIPTTIVMLFISLNLYINTTTFSWGYLNMLEFPAFAIYESLRINKDFDNYDIILIYILCVSTLFKIAYCIYMFRLLNKFKRKKDTYLNITLVYIVLGLIAFEYKTMITSNALLIVYALLVMPVLFFIFVLLNKGDDFYGV